MSSSLSSPARRWRRPTIAALSAIPRRRWRLSDLSDMGVGGWRCQRVQRFDSKALSQLLNAGREAPHRSVIRVSVSAHRELPQYKPEYGKSRLPRFQRQFRDLTSSASAAPADGPPRKSLRQPRGRVPLPIKPVRLFLEPPHSRSIRRSELQVFVGKWKRPSGVDVTASRRDVLDAGYFT